jgi:heme/copper-type cytochrome/quinol oxidase subunit 3
MSRQASPDRTGHEVVGDVSGLPDTAMGPRSLVWWGTLGFMLIEGTAFLLAAAVYLYLRGQAPAWPTSGLRPPDLRAGTAFTLLLLLSEAANRWLASQAKAKATWPTRWGMVQMTVAGVVLMGVRDVELAHLNVRWEHNAYGSATWLLMVLHTTHVLTDLGDTAVLGACIFTRKITASQFSDVNDNATYWTFVVYTWLPIYALVYWGPRLL